ncbi:hypothetical protein HUK80_06955 [Flavobacterium sp. MAH-1]|uniref:Uncharacterized protein n=1 Tax=Flavobacterium agri TaxID=2743471 RepID=A0A7Y9C6V4_9FLAO|nr:hypothetical protein [Flavobacterium agri]NUY80628.1 hypothetical protein [Flavobacterium agri]NYA70652.1 hypothetical protein [Flavobacterium agri]
MVQKAHFEIFVIFFGEIFYGSNSGHPLLVLVFRRVFAAFATASYGRRANPQKTTPKSLWANRCCPGCGFHPNGKCRFLNGFSKPTDSHRPHV